MFQAKIVTIILIAIAFMFSANNANSSVFWELKKGDATVYLLGSIHLANESFYPLDSAIENAFTRSDYLVTEINLEDVDAQSMAEQMYYPKGDSLPIHIADTTYQKVLSYFQDKGMSRVLVRKMKPSILIMTMMNIEYTKAGLSPMYGIDIYFTKKVESKPILQLETADSQMALLNKMSEGDDENLFVNSTFNELAGMTSQIDTMISAWKTGDLKTLEKIVFEQMKAESSEEKDFNFEMIDNRNNKMCDKIKEYFNSKATYFVIVGAAHLLGETGIVKQLEKQGFNPVRK